MVSEIAPCEEESELNNLYGSEPLPPEIRDTSLDDWESRYSRLKAASSSRVSTREKLQVAKDHINDPHPSVRYVAVILLREVDLKEAVDWLIFALADSYEWVRIRAIEGLGKRRSATAVEPFLRYLDEEESPKVKATLVKHLGRFEEERLIPVIAGFLNDEDARVRANAVEGLGFYPGDKVGHILEPLLKDSNARIRANVAVVLSKLPQASRAEATLEGMLRSKNTYERMGAVFAVGEMRSKNYFSLLLDFLNDPSYLVQRNVVDALSKFGISIQGPLLKEIRSRTAYQFRLGGIRVLGRVGDKKSLKTLTRLQEEGDGETRAVAEEAIDCICTRAKDSRNTD
jgi:HEAT repeat protein